MITNEYQTAGQMSASANQGVKTRHPGYVRSMPRWSKMHDILDWAENQKHVSSFLGMNGYRYLPMPAGIKEALASADQKIRQSGQEAEAEYMSRAIMPTWVKDARRAMVGMARELDSHIELPPNLEYIRENAGADGTGIEQLLCRVISETLAYGRCALLVDVDDNGKPFIAMYDAFSLINWKQGNVGGRRDLTLAVFEEHVEKGEDEFSHDSVPRWRVLSIDKDGWYTVRKFEDEEGNVVVDDTLLTSKGGRLNYIPLVICGSRGNEPDVDEMPLEGMMFASLTYYVVSADYQHSLHLTSHPQVWMSNTGKVNGDAVNFTGAGTAWLFERDVNLGYLEPQCSGMSEARTWMETQKNAAMEAGSRAMDVGAESGEARKARQSDQRATLGTVIVSAAQAIEACLRTAAEIMGIANPEKTVKYEVKADFSSSDVNPQMAAQIAAAVDSGKISKEAYWIYLNTGRLPERSYDEEQARIENTAAGDVPKPGENKKDE